MVEYEKVVTIDGYILPAVQEVRAAGTVQQPAEAVERPPAATS